MIKQDIKDADTEVIAEVLQGNKERYELLMRKYNQRLYRVAKAILWKEEEIEDAMQEAYIKAYQALPKFEERATFKTWLTRILINECLMRQREKKNRLHVPVDEDRTQSMLPADKADPEKSFINKEMKALLEYAISKLPEKYRVVFVMREIEQMNGAETGEALSITETNVKARLSRAKEMLRHQLAVGLGSPELLDFNLVRCDRIVKYVLARI